MSEPDPHWYRTRLLPLCRFLRRYHRARAIGVDCLPREGPALILGTHAPMSYDAMLGLSFIHEQTDRIPRGLIHDMWFQVPGVGEFFRNTGMEPASPSAAEEVLLRGDMIGVLPGGAREAYRSRAERYQLRWEGRYGFARLAIRTGAPIYIGACPAADLAMDMMFAGLSRALDRRYRILLPFPRGIGLTPVARPVKLTFLYEGPIDPGPRESEPSSRRVEALHALTQARMLRLIERGIELDDLPR